MMVIAIIVLVALVCGIYYYVFKGKKSKTKTVKEHSDKQESKVNASVNSNSSGISGELNFNESGTYEDFDDYELPNNERYMKNDLSNDDYEFNDDYSRLSRIFDNNDLKLEETDDEVNRSEVVKEIHKMSPKMKAILFANALERKDY